MVDVLIACEFSGKVRDAFILMGHNAVSCDLLPSESSFGPHIRGDVLLELGKGWDMLIAFPPCTYLASSGLHWNKRVPGRQNLTEKSLDFVRCLLNAPIDKIALENPIGCISTKVRKPDQIIQPWQFGHPESKSTCLWVKNLPLLTPTNVLDKPACGRWQNQTKNGQNRLPPSKDRAKLRSTTYTGIALAMATQWGK